MINLLGKIGEVNKCYKIILDCEDKNVAFYKDYKPPLVIRQIYKIDETYLI